MNFYTAKQIAEQWNLSVQQIRKYCKIADILHISNNIYIWQTLTIAKTQTFFKTKNTKKHRFFAPIFCGKILSIFEDKFYANSAH